jgi:hypothetical protein
MTIAEEQGVEASVAEFRKMFTDNQPTEQQLQEFQSRAATRARWKAFNDKAKLTKAS